MGAVPLGVPGVAIVHARALQLFVAEEVVLRDGLVFGVAVGQADSLAEAVLTVVGLLVEPLEENARDALVAEHPGAIGVEPVATLRRGQEANEGTSVADVHLQERGLRTFGGAAEISYIAYQCIERFVLRLPAVGDELADRPAVGIVDGGVLEEFLLAFELRAGGIRVVDVGHTPSMTRIWNPQTEMRQMFGNE